MQRIVIQERQELRIIQRARGGLELGAVHEAPSCSLQVHSGHQGRSPTFKPGHIRRAVQDSFVKAVSLSCKIKVATVVLGDRAGGDAADHRRVVRAMDRHRYDLARRLTSIVGNCTETVGDRLPRPQLLDRRLAVVGGVGPGAVGGQGESAVSPGRAHLRDEAYRVAIIIRIRSSERTAGEEVARPDIHVFDNGGGNVAGNEREVDSGRNVYGNRRAACRLTTIQNISLAAAARTRCSNDQV